MNEELKAMQVIDRALDGLTEAAQQRVLRWVLDAYGCPPGIGFRSGVRVEDGKVVSGSAALRDGGSVTVRPIPEG
jgi:hypothetical protein